MMDEPITYREFGLLFSQRSKIADEVREWMVNSNVYPHVINVVTALDALGYLKKPQPPEERDGE